eukprot:1159016-Pelagomonas_calceolata.AAC.7
MISHLPNLAGHGGAEPPSSNRPKQSPPESNDALTTLQTQWDNTILPLASPCTMHDPLSTMINHP